MQWYKTFDTEGQWPGAETLQRNRGIGVVFIQKLLGHNDIRTTLRYLHVTNKDLVHIISPLTDIEHLLKK